MVFAFLYLPIALLVVFSFNSSKLNIRWEGFSTKWYEALLTNKVLITAFENSLLVALFTTLLSTLLGTIGAWMLHRYRFPYQDYLGTRRMRTGADAQNAQLEWRGERRWGAHTLRYGFQGILQDRGLPRSAASSYGTGDRQRDQRLHAGVRWEHQRQNWHWSRGAFGWLDFQAFDAGVAPYVVLECTHVNALNYVKIEHLLTYKLPV